MIIANNENGKPMIPHASQMRPMRSLKDMQVEAFLESEIKRAKNDVMDAQFPANRIEALHRLETLQRVKRHIDNLDEQYAVNTSLHADS